MVYSKKVHKQNILQEIDSASEQIFKGMEERDMECKPWEMDEGMSLIMMRMRRSLRTVLREAVLEEGLTPNEIEVLLFLEHGTYNTARDISRLRGMPRSLARNKGPKPVPYREVARGPALQWVRMPSPALTRDRPYSEMAVHMAMSS